MVEDVRLYEENRAHKCDISTAKGGHEEILYLSQIELSTLSFKFQGATPSIFLGCFRWLLWLLFYLIFLVFWSRSYNILSIYVFAVGNTPYGNGHISRTKLVIRLQSILE